MTPRERAFDLAWDAVGRAERTTDELSRYLVSHGVEDEDAAVVLARLTELGYVSDGRIASETVRAAQAGRPVGKEKVKAKLLRRGIDENVVDQAVVSLDHAGEVERAMVLAAKLGTAAGPAKTARYLAARGFDEEAVRDVVERLFPD